MLAFLHSALVTVWAWIVAHPTIVWPLVTAILTSMLGKPTAEEYAAMSPRMAAFRRFIAATGLDVPKMIETLKLLIGGGVPAVAPDAAPTKPLPKDPPSGPMMAFVFVVLLGAAVSQSSCAPAANRKAVNGALDVVQVGCIVANQWSTLPVIAQICGIADALLPDLRAIVDSMRKAAVAGPPPCAFDGGMCLPKDAGAE